MSEWKLNTLKQLADIRVSNVDKKIYLNKSSVRLCNYMDVYSNNYLSNKHNFTTGSADSGEIQRFGLKVNDVIITKDSESPEDIAIPAVVIENLENVVCGYHLAILRPDPKIIDGQFLMLKMKHSELRDYFFSVANGSTRYGLTIGNIENAVIKYPPLPEQRRIARILSTCDGVIEKTKAAVAKYQAIKQGLLHDLFTRGIDPATGQLRPTHAEAPERYRESALGWIPREWEVRRLEEVTEKIGSGVTPTGGSEVYQSSGVLFIRSQNVLVGSLSIEDAAFITNAVDEKMEGSRVKPFDVLLNITGASIGRCAFFPKELNSANVNQHVCIIRFNESSESLSIFVSEFLNSNFGQSQISRSNAGGNREGLNFQQIKSFFFPEIKPDEIKSITNVIQSQTKKLQTEQTYLAKLESIKAGLMEDLLTGRVV